MTKQAISMPVKAQVERIVHTFNQRTFPDSQRYYLTRYKGPFLYLDRYELGRSSRFAV